LQRGKPRFNVKNRTTQSALLVAGAAAGVAALAWVGKRRHMATATKAELDPGHLPRELDSSTLTGEDDELTAVRRRPEPSQRDPGADDFVELVSEDLIESERPELPIGRSADPAIDDELRSPGELDETSGAALFPEPESDRPISEDISLEQIWDAAPRNEEERPAEGYDAVTPEDLGSVWLERATQTAREERAYSSDPADPAALDDLMISEATRASALPLDEDVEMEDENKDAGPDEDSDPNDVQEDDLDVDDGRNPGR
jgi:hypothetical protein